MILMSGRVGQGKVGNVMMEEEELQGDERKIEGRNGLWYRADRCDR